MNLKIFKEKLLNSPSSVEFTETIAVIDAFYTFTPSEFKNGN